ncbi:MAG: ATP phosphoribosyltransferase, partial [Clostridium sp.]|nr:ATP phosphoribosyltransferase [Clostridium sp.]
VFDRICDISARVIVNKASFKMKKEEIGAFINRLKQVL